MSKIMLVEDDNNLREIYEARLLAEGYEIVSAKDGEEALAMAVKEKPDLIIADVMMPKISGFDMLDILRSAPETKDAKIIMMTALGQAEDKARAQKLGADRYLVKSQVTLEDVARTAKEVLTGESDAPAPAPAAPPADQADPTQPAQPIDSPQAATAPAQDQSVTIDESAATTAVDQTDVSDTPASAAPSATSIPVLDSPAEPTPPQPLEDQPAAPTTDQQATPTTDDNSVQASNDNVLADALSTLNESVNADTSGQPAEQVGPPPVPEQSQSASPQPSAPASDVSATQDPQPTVQAGSPQSVGGSKVINPLNDISSPGVDLNALLERENAKNILSGQPSKIDVTSAPDTPAPGSSIVPTNTVPPTGSATDVGKISLS